MAERTALQLPFDEQPNLAPLEPLLAVQQDKPNQHSWYEWLKGRYQAFRKNNEESWRDIYSACHLVALFYEGKQLLRRSTFGNGWRPYGALQDTGQANIRAINVMRFYADNIVVKWVQSNADLVARPARDTDQAQGEARAANILIDNYETNWYTPVFRQKEAKLALMTGNYARRIYYSQEVKAKARRNVTEPRILGGGGTGYCADCGYSGNIQEFQQGTPQDAAEDAREMPGMEPQEGMEEQGLCPSCGSASVELDKVPQVTIDAVIGQEEYQTGDLVCESIPLFNLRFELTGTLEESPWLLYTRRVRKDVLAGKLLGTMKIDRGSGGDESGLDALESLARTGQAISGRSGMGSGNTPTGEEKSEYVDLAELWLDPDIYGDVILKESVKTISGQVIPAGPLRDTFPNGLCAMGINEFKTLLYVYDENHRDHWVSGQFHLKPLSGVGDGIVDSIEVQRQFNVGNSQIWTQIRGQATPAVLYDKDLLTGDRAAYLGHPQQNIPVDLSRLPDQRRLSDAVHQLPPGQIPGHVIEYTHQFLNNMFQLTAHTTDFSGGLPGVNNTTATGAQIAASNSQSLHSPQLQLLADVNCRTAKLMLKLFQRHCPDERYFALAGKYGKQDGVWLRAADIDSDLLIEVVPESHLPQSGLERRERMKEFITFFGGVEGLQIAQQQNPTLVQQLTDYYDLDIETNAYSVAALVARKRIEQMKAMLPNLEQQMSQIPMSSLTAAQGFGVDPMIIAGNMLLSAINPKPDIREAGHESAVAFYQEWLLTDEGIEAPPPLRNAVMALIDQHVIFSTLGLQVAAGVVPPPIGANGLPLGAPPPDPLAPPPTPVAAPMGPEGAPQEQGEQQQQQSQGQQSPTTAQNVSQSATPNYSGGGPGAMQ